MFTTGAARIASICRSADHLIDENQGSRPCVLFLLGRSNVEERDVERDQCPSQIEPAAGAPRA